MNKRTTLGAIAAVSVVSGFAVSLVSAPGHFDFVIREDFFAGFAGNDQALKRGMTKAEATLAEEPDHAEALVWHGAGLYYQAGQAFRNKDPETGRRLSQTGLAEMDRAVQLSPDSEGVRVPRGAALLTGTRFMPPDTVLPLIRRGAEDYEATLRIQAAFFDTLGTHPQGELLQGLADAYSRLGETRKAEAYYRRILTELPNTSYAKRAMDWLKTKTPLPAAQAGCIGCHNKK